MTRRLGRASGRSFRLEEAEGTHDPRLLWLGLVLDDAQHVVLMKLEQKPHEVVVVGVSP